MNKQQLDVYIFETIHQIEQNEQQEHHEKHEQQQRQPELEKWKKRYAEIQSQQLWNYLSGSSNNTTTTTSSSSSSSSSISRDEFSNSVLSTAKSVDVQRIWPLTLSMLMVGSTVGVTTPAMVRLSLRFFIL
jgi:hypothetical protein